MSPRLPIALPLDQQVRCDCGCIELDVIKSYRCKDESIRRRRRCKKCGERFSTVERKVLRHVPRADRWKQTTYTNHHVQAPPSGPAPDGMRCGCGEPSRSKKQRYCRACHAAAMRKHRHAHPLTPAQRLKMNARSYLKVYMKRGKIKRGPCEVAGCTVRAEAHHDDYSKPLQVRWLCREHHLLLHSTETPVMATRAS